MGAPKVFISYSWEDEEHKEWVKELADRLIENGVEATLDQYDLSLGDRLPQFMEQAVTTADYVLIICTPTYKEKADKRRGGVGYEGHIISGELIEKGNEKKFIPIIRKGDVYSAMPICLTGKYGIDLTDGDYFENNFKDLLTTIYGAKKKPTIGKRPSYVLENKDIERCVDDKEPIYIQGIITDEVTMPKMDGTRGSALYKIPFRLSKIPSELWKNIFLQTWSRPPRFTLMHRPGIAGIYGDKVVLDGTTMEEVRDYHRETLILCVEIANKKEKQILVQEQRKKEAEQEKKNQHYNKVLDIAADIKF